MICARGLAQLQYFYTIQNTKAKNLCRYPRCSSRISSAINGRITPACLRSYLGLLCINTTLSLLSSSSSINVLLVCNTKNLNFSTACVWLRKRKFGKPMLSSPPLLFPRSKNYITFVNVQALWHTIKPHRLHTTSLLSV